MRHHHHHHPSRLVTLGENLANLVETGSLAAMTLGSLTRAVIGAPFREFREGTAPDAAAGPSGITIAAATSRRSTAAEAAEMAGETPSPNGNPGPAGPEAPGKPPPSGPGAGVDLRERIDQMGTILAKGLDLAEAGVSLGVTILNRVSSAAQQKIREGLDSAAQAQSGAQSEASPGRSRVRPASRPMRQATSPRPTSIA